MATFSPDSYATADLNTSLGQLARRRTRVPQRRFAVAGLIIVAAVVYLVFSSFNAAVTSVLSPGQLLSRGAAAYGQTIRLQGKVAGRVSSDKALDYRFDVSDGHSAVLVAYGSDLPGGFKAGAQVEAQGTYNGHVFTATSLTAKCPTKYQAAASAASSSQG